MRRRGGSLRLTGSTKCYDFNTDTALVQTAINRFMASSFSRSLLDSSCFVIFFALSSAMSKREPPPRISVRSRVCSAIVSWILIPKRVAFSLRALRLIPSIVRYGHEGEFYELKLTQNFRSWHVPRTLLNCTEQILKTNYDRSRTEERMMPRLRTVSCQLQVKYKYDPYCNSESRSVINLANKNPRGRSQVYI